MMSGGWWGGSLREGRGGGNQKEIKQKTIVGK